MGSKAFLLLGLLLAIILLISSEVAARDLAETSSDQNNVEATKEANGVDVAKYGGYGGNPGGGYGGYPEPEGRHPRTLASGGNGGCGGKQCCRWNYGSKGCNRCCSYSGEPSN